MEDLQFKFFTQCVPVRSLLATCVYNTPDEYIKYWMAPAGLAAFAGIYKYATYDKDQLGAFGQNVWWQNSRIIHIIITLIFIILISQGSYKYARVLPIIDLIIGIGMVSNHYSNV
jgi:hypothetical protein